MLPIRRKWLITLGVAILLSVIFTLVHERILLTIGDFLIVEDNLQPADLIHVLGGGLNTRHDYAVHLYQQDYGQQIFATGGRRNWKKNETDCFLKDYLICHGVRPADLWPIESWATNTYEEALELNQFLASDAGSSIHSVIIVSDPYHMRRVQWTFRRVLRERVRLQFGPVPFEMTPLERRWWLDKPSKQMVKIEYLKIGYYYARYRFNWGLVRKWGSPAKVVMDS